MATDIRDALAEALHEQISHVPALDARRLMPPHAPEWNEGRTDG